MSNSEKKTSKFSLRKILYNDKMLVLISLFLSLVVWISISMNVAQDTEVVIRNVAVKIDTNNPVLTQLGLRPFNETETTVDVTIACKKYVVRNISSSDLSAVAETTNVSTAGKQSLKISVTKAETSKADFKIKNFNPTYVDAYFDTYSEHTADVEIDISGQKNIAEGFILGVPALSKSVAKVSGPTTEVNKVKKIVAQALIPEGTNATITADPKFLALDEENNEVNNVEISFDSPKVTLTIPVLKAATLPLGVNFVNAPAGFNETMFDMRISPKTLEIGAAETLLATTTKLIVGDIDFTSLTASVNERAFNLSDLSGITVRDSKQTTATVKIDLSSYKSKLFTVEKNNIRLTNVPEGYTAQIADNAIQNVGVLGPNASLKNVLPSDIYAVVDMTDSNVKSATTEYTVKLTLENHNDCWVIGTYKIPVTLTKV